MADQAPIPLSSREVYLYAQLVTLFNEQAEAIGKVAQGRAGFWTRGRIGPRAEKIKSVMGNIVRNELALGGGPLSYAIQRMEKKLLSNLGPRIGSFVEGAGEYAGTFVGHIVAAIDAEEAVQGAVQRLYEINDRGNRE
jgi:hypothetical protein